MPARTFWFKFLGSNEKNRDCAAGDSKAEPERKLRNNVHPRSGDNAMTAPPEQISGQWQRRPDPCADDDRVALRKETHRMVVRWW
jgi:hypothetical protein